MLLKREQQHGSSDGVPGHRPDGPGTSLTCHESMCAWFCNADLLSLKAMTKNIVAKADLEKPLILWNRTRKRAEEHSASIGHSTVAATVKEAVTKADIIWSCLQDQEAVTEIFEEILEMDIRGKLFLESSTVLPDVTNRIAKQVEEAGAEFVAMPGKIYSVRSV